MFRMKWNITRILFVLWTATHSLYASDIILAPSSDRINQFETLFIDIQLKHPFHNPYDPDDIRVDAIITTPAGETMKLPCFYKSGPSEKSQWEARFTGMDTGMHTYYIQAVTNRRNFVSQNFQVMVEKSDNNGFLRLNNKSLYSFVFDSGKRFRGVGLNVGWELQTEWKYPYEMYMDKLEENHANFFRTWMCTWNLPLEWTRMVMGYEGSLVDEFENWDKTFFHSPGLKIDLGKSQFTEDDTNRIVIDSNNREKIIYHIDDIRRFKIKLFYHKKFSTDKIRCYTSPDNMNYSPVDIEFSQTWNTRDEWHRMFIAFIYELPQSTHYLKIEFLKNLEGSPELGNIQIEYGQPKDVLDAPGLGRYYQKTANRLDEILRYTEKRGIYIMLTFDYHGIFKSFIDCWASNAEWRSNPYNAANGGSCTNQVDFFTNAEAKKIYKNKIRYLVARWGYSTHLACWEFFNEIDNVMGMVDLPAKAIVSWHQEMADYIKQIDPYKHLVSTSVTYREIPGLWDIKNIEFSQHHNYGLTVDMKASILKYVERFNKPDVVGEFALGWKGPGKDHPAELYEVEMHNGIWRGMFSPTPILPLPWWWEWHYHKGHYFHFKAAADFVSLMLKNNDDVIEEVSVKCDNVVIEAIGLKSGDDIFFWLRNSGNEEKNELALSLEKVGNSRYDVKTYDTWTGHFSEEMEIESLNDKVVLKNLRLKNNHDMAVWFRQSDE